MSFVFFVLFQNTFKIDVFVPNLVKIFDAAAEDGTAVDTTAEDGTAEDATAELS